MSRPISTDQYIRGIEAKLRRVKELDKKLEKTVRALNTEHLAGIFDKGLDGTSYSSRATLAGGNVFGNRNSFGNSNYTFATQAGANKFFGKKDKEWRRVNTPRGPRNLIVIEGGYKAIREADGRQTRKVDLTHTGLLSKDVKGSFTRTRAGWVVGVKQKDNVGKLEGAIDRYGQKLAVPDKLFAQYRPRLARIVAEFLTL